MFDLKGIWESEKKMKIATGLTLSEAQEILADFGLELNKVRRKDASSKVGRKPKLDEPEVFLMLMIFIRQYITFEFLSLLFEIDVSNVKRWVDDSFDALTTVLKKKNFCHLISVDQERLSKSNLNDMERSLLMGLSNL